MLITPASFASALVAIVGVLILWANPTRTVNRAVFAGNLQMALWLAGLHLAMTAQPGEGLIWLRRSCSLGALAPLCFWFISQSIQVDWAGAGWRWFVRNAGWFVVSTFLVVLPFTDYFIPSDSTATTRRVGWGYYAYMIVLSLYYMYLFLDTFRATRKLSGARKLELQVWLGGGCALALVILATMALNAVTRDQSYIRVQPLFVLTFYVGVAYAITTHRIFDGRQLLLVSTERTILVLTVAAAGYLLYKNLSLFLPVSLAFLATTGLALWLAGVVSGWLDRMFRFYPQATAARQAFFAIAQRETRVDAMEAAFCGVLKGWGQTDRAIVVSGTRDSLSGSGIILPPDSPVTRAMKQLRWATPERLVRERPTEDRRAVQQFLVEQNIGALVVGQGPSLTALVGVGIPASRRVFTYPQMTQLLELASIMESALERAHFSVKAQHAEQLATVGLLGASLAHEIRNPLVTIKTFVQLLPKHHHDPVFRHKFFGLIGDEVTRIDRLTEQLLDLASPRVYKAEPIELHPVLRTSLELVAAKATDKRIDFRTDFQASPDRAFTDASAAKQVLLNLCFNAIQAVESKTDGERWVKVATRNVPQGLEMIVEDSGPGISPAIRPRLFQPFQSTKSSGFGLGLAICSDILAGLDATISVDPTVPGRGALFRIVFPCPAS